MLPPAWRACLLVLLIVHAAPSASAQTPPETPDPLDCNAAAGRACLPDLRPQNPSASSEDERTPTTFCASFINIGSGPTATRFRVALLIDGQATAETSFDKVYQQGQGDKACWGPFPIPKGTHTMRVVVDSEHEVPEQDETNNALTATFQVLPAPEVDLRTRLVVTPQTADANRNVVFSANVTNLGALESPPSKLYLWDNGGTRVRFDVPPLSAGGGTTLVHVAYSNTMPVGRFLAEAEVDRERQIAEISELNNHASFEYEVLEHPAADLRIADVQVVGNVTASRGIRLDARVENVGDRIAQGVVLRVLNETNASLANASRTQLIPRANATLQLLVHLPAGNHTLRIVADPDGRVLERNETNNVAEVALEVIEIPPEIDVPNLIVERVQTPFGEPQPNQSVTFGVFVRNVGTNVSNKTAVSVTIQSRVVGTAPVPALKPGNSYYALVTWAGAPPGSYVAHSTIDAEKRVTELDEEDNTLSIDVYLAREEPVEETPPLVTPPTIAPNVTTPTPTTPTPPVNVTPPRLTISDMEFDIRSVPGGARGVLTIVVRNLNTFATPGYSLRWSVDGREVKQTLQLGVNGAGSATLSTGDIELPAGSHLVTAEIRFLGSTAASITREKPYDVAAGEKPLVPGFEAVLLLVALLAAFALSRRRSV